MNHTENPLQILTAKAQENWSGCVEIEESKDASIHWQVYFDRGRIQYVGSKHGQQARLNYLLQKFSLDVDFSQFDSDNISEYKHLCKCFARKKLSKILAKKLLFRFSREGLTHVLSIHKTNLRLITKPIISPAIISFSLQQLIVPERINAWRKIRHYFNSPFTRLYVERKNALKFYQIWKDLYAYPGLYSLAKSHDLSTFSSLFIVRHTLYEIAQKTQVDAFLLARYLELAVSEKVVYLLPFRDIENKQKQNQLSHNRAKTKLEAKSKSKISIVCIDDSKTVQKQVQKTLEAVGYQVTTILDPKMALKKLARLQPKIIFLDINMPDINGYDLCTILRKSQKYKDIPIVMLTGRDGVIDRVRAKLVGATDYLTKPCHPYKLIQIAENLIKKHDLTH